jgi:hypothetical protein
MGSLRSGWKWPASPLPQPFFTAARPTTPCGRALLFHDGAHFAKSRFIKPVFDEVEMLCTALAQNVVRNFKGSLQR